jgi:hypothetical protein
MMSRSAALFALAVLLVLAACNPSGHIETEAGKPLEDVSITLMSGSYRLFAQTDRNGYYEVAGLTMNRDYCIWPRKGPWEFDPEEHCIRKLFESHSNVDFMATHVDSFDISGQVFDMRGPVYNVALLLTGYESRSVRTNMNGFYTFRGLRGREDYCITPVQTGLVFEPVERCYTYLDSIYDDEDYLATETE